ncbi:zinc ribbon domain-containing protein [Chryseomicrobium palamuruense]
MVCSNCGNIQESGKFCGKCGTALVVKSDQTTNQVAATSMGGTAAASPMPNPALNEKVDLVKQQSKMYGSYFVEHLKLPSLGLVESKAKWINGLITYVLSILIVALITNTQLSKVMGTMGGGLFDVSSMKPSFFTIFFSSFVTISLIVGIAIGLIVMFTALFSNRQSFIDVFSAYAAHMNAILILLGISWVLILMNSFVYGNVVLFLSLLITFLFLPIYILIQFIQGSPRVMDRFYIFIAYLIVYSIALTVVSGFILDSQLGGILEELQYYM